MVLSLGIDEQKDIFLEASEEESSEEEASEEEASEEEPADEASEEDNDSKE